MNSTESAGIRVPCRGCSSTFPSHCVSMLLRLSSSLSGSKFFSLKQTRVEVDHQTLADVQTVHLTRSTWTAGIYKATPGSRSSPPSCIWCFGHEPSASWPSRRCPLFHASASEPSSPCQPETPPWLWLRTNTSRKRETRCCCCCWSQPSLDVHSGNSPTGGAVVLVVVLISTVVWLVAN